MKILFLSIILASGFVLSACNTGRKKACEHESLWRAVENYPESKYPNFNERAVLQENAVKKYFDDCMVMSQ